MVNEIMVTSRKLVDYLQVSDQKKMLMADYNLEEIIGESFALRCVLEQVEVVAPTDSTVLILGESGNG